MRAGELRHKLIIQTPTETADGLGGYSVAWDDAKTVWGALWPLRGREYLANQQVGS